MSLKGLNKDNYSDRLQKQDILFLKNKQVLISRIPKQTPRGNSLKMIVWIQASWHTYAWGLSTMQLRHELNIM